MTSNMKKLAAGFFRDDSGQTMVIATVSLVVLLAMCGFVVDMGRAIVVNRQLEAGTNAAALAGGQALPGTTYSSEGYLYSSQSKENNTYGSLPGVNTTVKGYCSSYVTNSLGIGCSGAAGYNAVVVTQSVTIPTYFISVLGIDSMTLTSTALAAERGSTPIPYNIALVLDQTASMQTDDSDSQCTSTREACAQAGIVTMLQNMAPCPITQSSCGTVTKNATGDGGANVTPAEDHVALFQFPNATFATLSNAYACNGSSTTNGTYYLNPNPSTTYYDPVSGYTYLTVGYSSDFKTNPQKTTLNSASNLVKAVGGYSGCTAEYPKGGAGTYYASALYAAQGSLVQEQKTFPNTTNVIVIVSDGDATEDASDLNTGSANASYPYNTTGAYPSAIDECNQAVIAAKAATTAGTKVYAVSYGSEASGCTYTQTTGTGSKQKTTTVYEGADYTGYTASITPCETMKGIASSTANFYSDYSQSGSGADSSCVGTATSTTNLNQIFTDIAYTLTTSRLLNAGLNSGCSASNVSACQ
jgi:Flp pilus assembly protein TadG